MRRSHHQPSKVKARHRSEIRKETFATGALMPTEREDKTNNMPKKQLRERKSYTLDCKRPMFIWRFVRTPAGTTQERQRKGTRSFTFSDRFSAPKFQRCRKRGDDGGATGTPTSGESEQITLYKPQQRKLLEGNSCNGWHVPECTKFKAPGEMQVRRQVCIQTHSLIC